MKEPLPVWAYGDSYGGVAQNALAQQSLEDNYLLNMLNQKFRQKQADSDTTFRQSSADRDESYRRDALGQSGSQFDRSFDFQRDSRATDNEYRLRALNQSREQFDKELDFRGTGRTSDNKYRYDVLGQDADRFGRSLAFQKDSRDSDSNYRNAALVADLNYKYSALNANQASDNNRLAVQNDQFMRSLAENAAQRRFSNDFANKQFDASRGDRVQDVGYRDRALDTQTDLSLLGMANRADEVAASNERADRALMLNEERRGEAEQTGRYNQLQGLIANGVIRSTDDLQDWENGQLSSQQWVDLDNLREEAGRRTNMAYDANKAKADALSAQLASEVSPLKPRRDAAQAEYDAANDRYWKPRALNPLSWLEAFRTTKDEVNQAPILAYNKANEEFRDNVSKSKIYGDVLFDPVSGKYIPLTPRPDSYEPRAQAAPAPVDLGPIVPIPGTGFQIPQAYATKMLEEVRGLPDADRAAYTQRALAELIKRGIATRAATPPR